MKIAYFAEIDIGQESGVLKKVLGQMMMWADYGHETRLFAVGPTTRRWEGLGNLDVEAGLQGRPWQRLTKVHAITKKIIDWQADIVYVRFALYYPSLEQLMRQIPTVIEINGDDIAELKQTLACWQYLYHRMTRNRTLRSAKAIVTVTHEIEALYKRYNKPQLTIGNGIDLSAYSDSSAPKNLQPNIVFIGVPGKAGSALASWHGVEKILVMADNFPEWHFDIVGYASSEEISSSASVPSNVELHGYLNRSQYQAIMSRANIAIGTLALYKNHLNEASPLKVREYLANGIPTIIGYKDTDFPQSPPFLLQLPNTPDNVVNYLREIKEFVDNWTLKRVQRIEVQHLDVKYKEQERLNFFESILR